MGGASQVEKSYNKVNVCGHILNDNSCFAQQSIILTYRQKQLGKKKEIY